VIEGKTLSDDIRGVIGAVLERSSREQPAHDFLVAGQVERHVRGHPEFAAHKVGCAGLLHVSRDSVQDEPASGRLCGDHRLSQHVEYDLIGHEFAAVEIVLNGMPKEVRRAT
jgi:hypothetical protein